MTTATVIPLHPAAEAHSAEAFTAQDVTELLDAAADLLSEHRVGCTRCRTSPTDVCRDHDADDRMAFLAELFRDGVKAAGEEVTASLIALGRTARKDARAGLPCDGGEPA